MKKLTKKLFFGFVLIGAVYILIITILMLQISRHKPEPNAGSMIILGAKLNGNQPSLSLRYRLDVAVEYLLNNPATSVIVSGGRGVDELISEAEAMKSYLINNQIAEARIQTETLSTSTYENIKFSKKLLKVQNILLVSNDFHLLRAKMIAERQDLIVDTLAAPTPKSTKLLSYLREYIAFIKSFLLD